MARTEKWILFISLCVMGLFGGSIYYAVRVLNIRVATCVEGKTLFKEPRVIIRGDKKYEVHLLAKMWAFEPAEIKLPVGALVDFYLASKDVTHGFHIHGTNANVMVVPGALNTVRVKFERPGIYSIVCHEYCGAGHQNMRATIVVKEGVSDQEVVGFRPAEKSGAAPSLTVLQEKGCIACHSVDGSPLVGPTFKGLFGKKERLKGGEPIVVDARYLKESILEPQKKIVEGYEPVMPKLALTSQEIDQIIQFIETLK